MIRRWPRWLFLAGVLSLIGMRFCLAWDAADQHDIGVMENHLYHSVYEAESQTDRLNRLEQTVFGTVKTGETPEARLSKLRHVVPVSTPAPVKVPSGKRTVSRPKHQPASTPGDAAANPANVPPSSADAPPDSSASEQTSHSPNESDYPVVDAMEQKVLGQTYLKEDLNQRLPRLEAKVFGAPQTGDLSSRVDRLHDVVLGRETGGDSTAAGSGSDGASSGVGNVAPPIAVTPEQVAPSVEKIERQLFHHTYASEPIEARLTRIENKLFNAPAQPGLSPSERLERIIAVASAGGQNPTNTTSPTAAIARQLLPIVIMLLPLFI